MKALIIGASGQVGWELFNQLKNSGYDVIGMCKNNYQEGLIYYYNSHDAIVKKGNLNLDVVFLPAAVSHVDLCEEEKDNPWSSSKESNIHLPVQLIDTIKEHSPNIKFVFFSSDYVFNGKYLTNGQRKEDGMFNNEKKLVCPINEYGKQKVAIEHYLLATLTNYLIIRTSGVFNQTDPQKKNFVHQLRKNLKAKQIVRVPVDQIGTPTWCPDLVSKTIKLVEKDATGIFNITGGKFLSRYEFARQIAESFDYDDSLIYGMDTINLNQKAPRPLCGGLPVEKVQKFLNEEVISPYTGLLKCNWMD